MIKCVNFVVFSKHAKCIVYTNKDDFVREDLERIGITIHGKL